VHLRFDPQRTDEERACDRCGRSYRLVKGFVLEGDQARAIYFVACHDHHDGHEAWIDVILGTFGADDPTDHVTFGCRVGAVSGQEAPAASVVQAAAPYGDAAIWGRKLSREEALAHPWLPRLWEVVDFVLTDDSTVHAHVYG
jgi:hypothetical protein